MLLGWWWHSRCLLIVRLAKQLTVSHTEVLAGTEYFLAVLTAEAVQMVDAVADFHHQLIGADVDVTARALLDGKPPSRETNT